MGLYIVGTTGLSPLPLGIHPFPVESHNRVAGSSLPDGIAKENSSLGRLTTDS